MADDEPWTPPEEVVVPISDELDLHWFRPKDCGPVVRDWLPEAWAAGFRRVRIVHGKGIGSIRRAVHRELERHPLVLGFEQADRGNWGATVALLRDTEPSAEDS